MSKRSRPWSRFIPASAFGRNVGLLAGGTLAAQVIMALSLPILTRLYSPDHFSALAVYVAAIGLGASVSCLRYNVAIPLPEDDDHALSLLFICLGLAAIAGAILFAAVSLLPGLFTNRLGMARIEPYLWMLPIGIFLASVYNAVVLWCTRMKQFKLVAATQMTRAAGGAGAQVAIGTASASAFGLLFGHLIFVGMGIFGLGRYLLRAQSGRFRPALRADALIAQARAFIRFPKYSVPEAFLSTAGLQIPVLIIAAAALGPEAGFLMLAMRVMGIPMTLLGRSVSKVYLASAPEEYRQGGLVAFTRSTMWTLLRIGGAPILAAGVLAPFVFPLVFGAEWARSGVIVTWLTPLFVLQFVTSPVSVVLHVTGQLRTAMLLQLGGFVLRIGAVLAAARLASDMLVETFAISTAVFYLAYLIVVLRLLKSTAANDGTKRDITPSQSDVSDESE